MVLQVKRIGADALEFAQSQDNQNQFAVAEVMYKQVRRWGEGAVRERGRGGGGHA